MKAKIKSKVKAKAAAVKAKAKGIKAKVKAKCKGGCAKCTTCASLIGVLLLFAGCMDTNPASRATSNAIGDLEPTVKICIGENACSNAVSVVIRNTFGDGAIASADAAGSTETQTATPTMAVRPDVDVDVPVTKGGAASDALGSLVGGAISGATQGGSSSTCPNAGSSSDGCTGDGCTLKASDVK